MKTEQEDNQETNLEGSFSPDGMPQMSDSILNRMKSSPLIKEEENKQEDAEEEEEDKDKDSDLEDGPEEDLEEDKTKQVDKSKDKDKDKDKSKDKEEEETEDEDNGSIIAAFKEKLGVEDIEGEFDEDFEGIQTLFSKVLEKEKASSILEGQTQLLEEKPLLKALNDHLEAGYAIDSFLQEQQLVDWDSVKIVDENDEIDLVLAERIFREARIVKGIDKEEIDDAWNAAKDNDKVKERTESSIKYLKEVQEKQVKEKKESEKAEYEKAKKQEEDNLAQVEKVLKSGNINGVALDSNKIKELRKFSLEQDKKGQTERDRKLDSLTTEQWLLLDYIVMNDFKDLGVKTKVSAVNTNAKFLDLKNKEAAKKKVQLNNTSSPNTERKNIDVKSLFPQK